MVTGRQISEPLAAKLIQQGYFATNIKQAVSKFGMNFVPISPVYPSCQVLVKQLADKSEVIETNCLYVRKPANF